MRLQKFLARSGVASRRRSEDLMTAGRVTVNGEVITELGAKVDPLTDTVAVDGEEVTLTNTCIYLILNKPTGFLTTMNDPQGRRTITELVPHDRYPGLFPVGRLDKDTSGLLIFTTDGELAHRLLHPKHGIEKRYRALVEGEFTEADADALRRGIELDDGPTAPAKISIDRIDPVDLYPSFRSASGRQPAFLSNVTCIITEGRKRQVRRMFSALSHPVIELHRDRFGPIGLGTLESGEWRYLDEAEIHALIECV